MSNSFYSYQAVEMFGPRDTYKEAIFEFHMVCTDRGSAPTFVPRYGGDPGWAPEFEVVEVRVDANKEERALFSRLVLTWDQFVAFVGAEIAEALLDNAHDDAVQNGEY